MSISTTFVLTRDQFVDHVRGRAFVETFEYLASNITETPLRAGFLAAMKTAAEVAVALEADRGALDQRWAEFNASGPPLEDHVGMEALCRAALLLANTTDGGGMAMGEGYDVALIAAEYATNRGGAFPDERQWSVLHQQWLDRHREAPRRELAERVGEDVFLQLPVGPATAEGSA